jgi:hypothetical protein
MDVFGANLEQFVCAKERFWAVLRGGEMAGMDAFLPYQDAKIQKEAKNFCSRAVACGNDVASSVVQS